MDFFKRKVKQPTALELEAQRHYDEGNFQLVLDIYSKSRESTARGSGWYSMSHGRATKIEADSLFKLELYPEASQVYIRIGDKVMAEKAADMAASSPHHDFMWGSTLSEVGDIFVKLGKGEKAKNVAGILNAQGRGYDASRLLARLGDHSDAAGILLASGRRIDAAEEYVKAGARKAAGGIVDRLISDALAQQIPPPLMATHSRETGNHGPGKVFYTRFTVSTGGATEVGSQDLSDAARLLVSFGSRDRAVNLAYDLIKLKEYAVASDIFETIGMKEKAAVYKPLGEHQLRQD